MVVTRAQRDDAFVASIEHAAIKYSAGPTNTTVDGLSRKLGDGSMRLAFDPETGYLRSTLALLNVPTESQIAVFSQTSNQAKLINPRNPRAIFFNDTTAVGWVRGATALELAAQDPEQGVIFYTLQQSAAARPRFERETSCLECHLSWDTLGVPGMFVMSTFQRPDDSAYAGGFVSDDAHPVAERWGGWYVTGQLGSIHHAGNIADVKTEERAFPIKNAVQPLSSLKGLFDLTGYPTAYSDVVALMILEHQTHAMNLLTRLGWETRVAMKEGGDGWLIKAPGGDVLPERVRSAADALADYFLFVDEAPLPGKIRGTSGFAEKFAASGPRDHLARSLRELELEHRLMRYPCSYMIYSDAFDHLPAAAREAVYHRLWQILSGQDKQRQYVRLSLADRRAVVDILRDTRKGLPAYFGQVQS